MTSPIRIGGYESLEHDVQVIGHNGIRANTPRAVRSGFTEVCLKPILVKIVAIVAYNVLSAISKGHEVLAGGMISEA